eukprot:gene6380-10387_t
MSKSLYLINDKKTIKSIFDSYDTNGDGTIDEKEFIDVCYDLLLFPDETTVKGAMKALDKDNNSTIDFNEFYDWWSNNEKFQIIQKNIDKTAEAATLFKKYDSNKNGQLEKDEFEKMFQELVDQKLVTSDLQKELKELFGSSDSIHFNTYLELFYK